MSLFREWQLAVIVIRYFVTTTQRRTEAEREKEIAVDQSSRKKKHVKKAPVKEEELRNARNTPVTHAHTHERRLSVLQDQRVASSTRHWSVYSPLHCLQCKTTLYLHFPGFRVAAWLLGRSVGSITLPADIIVDVHAT